MQLGVDHDCPVKTEDDVTNHIMNSFVFEIRRTAKTYHHPIGHLILWYNFHPIINAGSIINCIRFVPQSRQQLEIEWL